jgi:hypothetical protein
MIFIPFREVLGGSRELLLCSDLVPFVFKGDKYFKEPSFLIAGHEV